MAGTLPGFKVGKKVCETSSRSPFPASTPQCPLYAPASDCLLDSFFLQGSDLTHFGKLRTKIKKQEDSC